MMKLVLIRHAKAQSHGASDNDYQRALTAKGECQSTEIAKWFTKHDVLADIILTSPVLRAQQTAQIISTSALLPSPITEPWLRCGMSPESALAELAAYADFSCVVIVGHEPDLSQLAERILGMPSGRIHLRKASVLELSCRPPVRAGGGVIENLYTPTL